MADNLKLPLVDDNPMVLGMLQHALSSLAQMTTASEAADALLQSVDDAPDLLVGDCRMPGMDGRQPQPRCALKKDEEEDVLLDG